VVYDENVIAQAVAQYKDGIPRGRICRNLGISTSTLYKWLADRGIKPDRTLKSGVENLHFHYKKVARHIVEHAISRDEDIEEVIKKLSRRVREEYLFQRLKRPMIGSTQVVTLSPQDTEQFVETYLNPPDPSEEAVEAAKRYAEKMHARDPLDEPKQPRTVVRDQQFVDYCDAVLSAPLGSPEHHVRMNKEYAQAWTPGIDNDLQREIIEEDLIDIEAEDAKNICEMCGNLINTEYCCKWEDECANDTQRNAQIDEENAE